MVCFRTGGELLEHGSRPASAGTSWADGGVGRIGFGTLEHNWRSVSTPRRACDASCVTPLLAADGGLLEMVYSLVGSNNGTAASWTTVYNYLINHNSFNMTKVSNYYRDTVIMHYHTVSRMPNEAVVGVTILSALVIVCLLFMMTPLPKTQACQPQHVTQYPPPRYYADETALRAFYYRR